MEVKHSANDTLFTDLFSDPEYILQLYQCLHPEDTGVTLDDIESVKLEAVWVTGRMYNDLGF